MRDDSGGCETILGAMVLGAVISAVACIEFGHKPKIKEMQAKAVELGAAEWQVDQKTGRTQFKWGEPKP